MNSGTDCFRVCGVHYRNTHKKLVSIIILTGFATAICFCLNCVLKTKTSRNNMFFFFLVVIPPRKHTEDDTHRFTVAFIEGGADDV